MYSQKNKIKILRHYLHFDVHCSTIYNSQGMETTHMSVDRWSEKMRYLYSGVSFNLTEGNPVICNMSELEGHSTKWNTPVTEDQILHDSTFIRYLNHYNHRSTEEWWLPEAGRGRNKKLLFNDYNLSIMSDEYTWRPVGQHSTCG